MYDFTSISKCPNTLVKTQVWNTSSKILFGVKPINTHTHLWQPLQHTTWQFTFRVPSLASSCSPEDTNGFEISCYTHTHTELLTSLHIKQWGHQDTPELVLTRPSPGLMLVKWTSSRHAHWLINGSVVDRIALSQMPFKVLAYNKNIQKSVIVFLSWLLLSAFKNRKALSTNTWSTNTV